MSVKVGDSVRFLNDVGGGTVTRIKEKTAYVLIEEGFEIPVNLSELVIVNSKESSEKKEDQPKPNVQYNTDFQVSYNYSEREESSFDEFESTTINKTDESIESTQNQSFDNNGKEFYLAFVSEKTKKNPDESVKLYLINNSEYYLLYSIGIFEGNDHALLDAGMLEPQVKVFISEIAKETFPSLKGLSCQAIKYKKGIFEPVNTIDEELKIKSYKLLTDNTFKSNDYFDLPAWLLPLESNFNDDEKVQISPEIVSKVIAEKEKLTEDKSKRFKKRPEPVLVEVDLHINQLVDDSKGMTNTEMLAIQLGKFRSELEKAISEKTHRIVFIHGIGNGTLKLAIRKELEEHYSHFQYQDASYQEYGYGATMVILRR